MKFADIIFQQKTGFNTSTLTYSIPSDLGIKIGQSVMIPLRNRQIAGLVWRIHEQKPVFRTLNIEQIIAKKPLLSENQIKLINWMAEYYFCHIYKILKLFIPKRVFDGKPMRQGIKEEEEIIRSGIKKLTTEQEKTVKEITTKPLNNFLIHGITGSGKTEIYTKLANNYIKQGKQALILVPEISLTPQIIEYFEKSLGIRATVIHSKISEGEKYKAWTGIWKNESKLIIGSRSAVFSPFQDLGIIIIDEEHELSYKQENSPRYTVHTVVDKMLELQANLKIVLGSATPSIETAEKLKNSTISLTKRIGKSVLPDIEIVDLREEFKKKNYSIFSESLRAELKKILEKKEQALFFLNRRGSASSVVCRDCGYKEKCKGCETTMTYHSRTLGQPKLICHHCGKIDNPPSICPICKGPNIRFLGIGTQKIEAELKKEFPNARVLRADKDSTSTKHGFKNIYDAFKNHEADILIGTQMIAKGLHLPKVNLVGVILADIGLNIPNFKTAERTFQLITQVAGRAGRSDSKGKVIIQSYNPENISLICAKTHDYSKFFNYERTQRKLLINPPFSKLAKLTIENRSLIKCKKEAEKIENLLWKIAIEKQLSEKFEINYYPSYISKFRGKYRYIILIKSTSKNPTIHNLLEKLSKEYIIDTNIKIDIDPITVT